MKSEVKNSLRKRLTKSFLTVILIPNLFLAIMILCISMYFIHQNTVQVVEGSNRTTLNSIENTIASVSSLSNFPALNQNIINILRKDYEDYGSRALLEQINDAKTIENDLSVQIYHMNQSIHSVFLLPANANESYGAPTGWLDNRGETETTDWYQKIYSNHGKVTVVGRHPVNLSTGQIDCITIGRCLIDSMHGDALLGVLFINIPVDKITAMWADKQFSENSFTILVDEMGNVINHSDVVVPESELREIAERTAQGERSNFIYYSPSLHKYFLSINSSADNYGWHISSLIPVDQLFSSGFIMITVLVLIIFMMLTILIYLSNRTARRITQPVDELKETIRQIERGNLLIKAKESDDEIGLLAKSFNHMTKRLHYLIQKIQIEQKEKHNAELLALQSQINPHFLYNTLNSIKFMAQIQGASSVSQTLDSLVSFLRFCSKNTEEVITLREELLMTEKYVEIMNIRYMDCIRYHVSVPEELMENATIRFLLQPVIENAMVHGFESDLDDRSILVKAVRRDEEITIQIADNGKGIPAQTADRLIKRNFETKQNLSSNIGLYNINQRIKFSFGQQYGISIYSKEKFYTVVEAHIPLITKEEWSENGKTKDSNR